MDTDTKKEIQSLFSSLFSSPYFDSLHKTERENMVIRFMWWWQEVKLSEAMREYEYRRGTHS